MFFFIGGISPRIKKLDELPGICPRCGLSTLFRVRIDHYLNLFFIPLFPVKKGRPVKLCENCGLEISEHDTRPHRPEGRDSKATGTCPACGRHLEPGFRFCPYCGRSLN
ncbi:MAG: hypothetical protein OP8BY_1724 [Candidatus Saccharicenans subterraneus]|uniref:Zinc-ribbon 15 domain-containing protein n=1 Tax=Candidatus Saccharicenans subterraneus TaxID=2508984 RepID=A0A3E2BPI2_9BACT|nr:MAG: hypothetical protein OP8BY_1724 [Candidatus Saccharicenans subterraneum]